jgi:hypothetical protein
MTQLFANNVFSLLATAIDADDTTIQLSTGTGSRFPSPTGGDYFLITLYTVLNGVESGWEIIKVTARSTDTLTVEREQEGTTARVFGVGTPIQLRWTAGSVPLVALSPDSIPEIEVSFNDEFEYSTALDTTGARRSGATAWAWRNQANGVANVSQGLLQFQAVASNTPLYSGVEQVIAPPFGIVMKAWPLFDDTDDAGCGLYVANNSTGRALFWGWNRDGGQFFDAWRGEFPSTFNASISGGNISLDGAYFANPKYLKMLVESPNVYFSYSLTGADESFVDVDQEVIADYVGTIDRAGIFVKSGNNQPVSILADWIRQVS